jgi:threonine/homoserine/homoserine lactone efflux protein
MISAELFAALVLYSFVSSVTPGPNNMMLLASGANFGLRRTFPHMLGISIGFSLMIALIGIGMMQVFQIFPVLHVVLKWVSLAYMLWLAWKISNAGEPKASDATAKPMTFLQAAAFQWVNPKAWTMALYAITNYAPAQSLPQVFVVAGVFGAINLPTVNLWAYLGQEMKRFLNSPIRLRVFNWTMAVLLVASVIPVVFH